MPKITVKTIQTHTECACGYNEVDSEKLLISHAKLIESGCKKHNRKKGGMFYTMLNKVDCKGRGHEE